VELVKKNIHMDRVKARAISQFAPEDDVNIPDSKPDVDVLYLSKGEFAAEEIRPGTDAVNIRGNLEFVVLYHTREDGSRLEVMSGRIPFDEKIYLSGAAPTDTVTVEGKVEDLTVTMINSRKLNVRSLVTVTAFVEELYDEEVPVALKGDERCEYRSLSVDIARIAIRKNDIFRVKEEFALPAGYPNIFRILWDDVSLGNLEFKTMEEKLSVSGEVQLSLLYEGEGEEHPVRSFEAVRPFSGVLDCHGAKEGMIPDITCRTGQKELAVRPDYDGEERNIGMELALDMGMHIYQEEKLQMLSDIYGVNDEVTTVTCPAKLRRLLSRVTGKTRLTERTLVEAGSVLQLLHSEGKVNCGQQTVVEDGILLQGSLEVWILYITGEDESPFGSLKVQLPFQYTLDVPGIGAEQPGQMEGCVEQLQVTMADGEELEIKAVLGFSTIVFQNMPVDIIGQVSVSPMESKKRSSLPGMTIVMAKEGDNLWNIGKKYYVSVDSLRKANGLENSEIHAGQKILVVKGM
jgi:hypothetical protein